LIAGKKRKTSHRKRAGSDELIAGENVTKDELKQLKEHLKAIKEEFANTMMKHAVSFEKKSKGVLYWCKSF
jgi:hypothetical protein